MGSGAWRNTRERQCSTGSTVHHAGSSPLPIEGVSNGVVEIPAFAGIRRVPRFFSTLLLALGETEAEAALDAKVAARDIVVGG